MKFMKEMEMLAVYEKVSKRVAFDLMSVQLMELIWLRIYDLCLEGILQTLESLFSAITLCRYLHE